VTLTCIGSWSNKTFDMLHVFLQARLKDGDNSYF
jgi:hypothetical protein